MRDFLEAVQGSVDAGTGTITVTLSDETIAALAEAIATAIAP